MNSASMKYAQQITCTKANSSAKKLKCYQITNKHEAVITTSTVSRLQHQVYMDTDYKTVCKQVQVMKHCNSKSSNAYMNKQCTNEPSKNATQ